MGRFLPATVILLIVVINACSPSNSPTLAPTSTSAEASIPPEFVEAVRFRKEFGLRSDLEFVRAVTLDPRASSREFGVPLLPEEIADLNLRASTADAVIAVVEAEAAKHSDDYGGLYIDQERGGVVVSLWTANLAEHAAVIRLQLDPRFGAAFRQVRYTEAELNELQERIGTNWEWMLDIPAKMTSSAVDIAGNRIELYISSAIPGASAAVLTHYDAPPGMLLVQSDGTGEALIPWGRVRIVVTINGQPVGENDFGVDWQSNERTYCGIGDMGFGVGVDGRLELPCQAGRWTIRITRGVGDETKVIGQADVIVPPDGVVDLEIQVSP
jgi:hypothetical protein